MGILGVVLTLPSRVVIGVDEFIAASRVGRSSLRSGSSPGGTPLKQSEQAADDIFRRMDDLRFTRTNVGKGILSALNIVWVLWLAYYGLTYAGVM
jgi:hypothetical protein